MPSDAGGISHQSERLLIEPRLGGHGTPVIEVVPRSEGTLEAHVPHPRLEHVERATERADGPVYLVVVLIPDLPEQVLALSWVKLDLLRLRPAVDGGVVHVVPVP